MRVPFRVCMCVLVLTVARAVSLSIGDSLKLCSPGLVGLILAGRDAALRLPSRLPCL